MKRLVVALGAAVAVYVLYVAVMYGLQDALIFPAPEAAREDLDRRAAAAGVEVVEVVASDGTRLYGWHAEQGGTRALIYFHGNASTVEAVAWFAQQLPGWDVVCVAYRGYPGSEGSPSEAGLRLDARAVWVWVTEALGILPERVVLHGQSLGGGVAHLLIEEVRPSAVVFDSTFLSIQQLARPSAPLLPLSLLLRSPFRSDLRAPGVEIPALVLHGSADTLIPVEHGRQLAKLLPNATYLELAGRGHNDWMLDDPTAFSTWKRFLEQAVPAP